MDEKTKKKRSKIDKSNLGSNFELEPNKGKKKKHKERKKNADDKILNSNETLEENCTGEAAEKQTCSVERNITFMGNKEEESHINKRKKKKRGKDIEMMDSNIADDKEVQFLDQNQQSRKKRKNYDGSLTGMREMGFSKPSKKGKMTVDNELKNNEGDPPLERISTGNANAHSLAKEDDCQGKRMEKKKLSNKSKKKARDHKINEGDHSVVIEEGQGKKIKMETILSKKNKRTEDEEYETNGGDPFLAQSNVVDPLLVESNDDDQRLVKSNEGDDDEQGKKKKKVKKKKLSDESEPKEYDEFKSNEGEDYDKGKKRKKKKVIEENKPKEYNKFRSNEGEDGDQGKMMKKKLSLKSRSKEKSEFNSNDGNPPLAKVESRDANALCVITEVNDKGKKMKKEKKVKAVTVTGESPNPARDGTSKPKRVTFSNKVEVCCDGLVRGKRFTPEEDEKIKVAVFDYIKSHGLGDQGLDMILHCQSHPEVRDCWKEIRLALPERPHWSVYHRAHILFERNDKHGWTTDELEFIRKVRGQHGSDWKSIAEALGRNRYHVKDAWRRIKLNVNKGHWAHEEYQTLFDLVNQELRARAEQSYRKSNHGMLRDNVSWDAVSEKLATRDSSCCCRKWYKQLSSPMVANGVWCADDYHLLNALYTLDACCLEEVDWDNLLEHRPGDVCRKRWKQMVQHIGDHGGKLFAEQVEILAKRYCPYLLKAREAFDNKPVVC